MRDGGQGEAAAAAEQQQGDGEEPRPATPPRSRHRHRHSTAASSSASPSSEPQPLSLSSSTDGLEQLLALHVHKQQQRLLQEEQQQQQQGGERASRHRHHNKAAAPLDPSDEIEQDQQRHHGHRHRHQLQQQQLEEQPQEQREQEQDRDQEREREREREREEQQNNMKAPGRRGHFSPAIVVTGTDADPDVDSSVSCSTTQLISETAPVEETQPSEASTPTLESQTESQLQSLSASAPALSSSPPTSNITPASMLSVSVQAHSEERGSALSTPSDMINPVPASPSPVLSNFNTPTPSQLPNQLSRVVLGLGNLPLALLPGEELITSVTSVYDPRHSAPTISLLNLSNLSTTPTLISPRLSNHPPPPSGPAPSPSQLNMSPSSRTHLVSPPPTSSTPPISPSSTSSTSSFVIAPPPGSVSTPPQHHHKHLSATSFLSALTRDTAPKKTGTLFITNFRLSFVYSPESYGATAVASVVARLKLEKKTKKSTAEPALNNNIGCVNMNNGGVCTCGAQRGDKPKGCHVAVTIPLATISSMKWTCSKGSRTCKIICKDIKIASFSFTTQDDSADHIEKLLDKLVFVTSVTRLFAFYYRPTFNENGWNIYDPLREYRRLGIPDSTWRISEANMRYTLCPSYPTLLVVPYECDDELIRQAAQFRTSSRFPVFSWRHIETGAVIMRSSQPKAGLLGNRNSAEEDMLRKVTKIRGKLVFIDARPKVNAVVNQTKGAGFEDPLFYDNTVLHFLGIENIHVMRESFKKVREASMGGSDQIFPQITASGWFTHLQALLQGASKIAGFLATGTSVLVHCSDGWDRTPQLTSLAQVLLDPFSRTIRGFEILIEKEWLSFGHKFSFRIGHGRKEDNERSPTFLQFLDCVFQISLQFPVAFEFNDSFLLAIVDSLYSCRFGTFLADCQFQRTALQLALNTVSLWSEINSNLDPFLNTLYSPTDKVIWPKTDIRYLCYWQGCYQRYPVEYVFDSLGWREERNNETSCIEQYSTLCSQEPKNRITQAIVLSEYDSQDDEQMSISAAVINLPAGTRVIVLDATNENLWMVAMESDPTAKGYFPRFNLQPISTVPDEAKPESVLEEKSKDPEKLEKAEKPSPKLEKLYKSKMKNVFSISAPSRFVHVVHVGADTQPVSSAPPVAPLTFTPTNPTKPTGKQTRWATIRQKKIGGKRQTEMVFDSESLTTVSVATYHKAPMSPRPGLTVPDEPNPSPRLTPSPVGDPNDSDSGKENTIDNDPTADDKTLDTSVVGGESNPELGEKPTNTTTEEPDAQQHKPNGTTISNNTQYNTDPSLDPAPSRARTPPPAQPPLSQLGWEQQKIMHGLDRKPPKPQFRPETHKPCSPPLWANADFHVLLRKAKPPRGGCGVAPLSLATCFSVISSSSTPLTPTTPTTPTTPLSPSPTPSTMHRRNTSSSSADQTNKPLPKLPPKS
ncbi:Myotubularin 1 [Pelomyxa schiedti]|nr:Myotubularin 1 [Pelomyxa schiedti]